LNPEKYGIKEDVHIMFWESEDGKNNYSVRLKRFERFCKAINSAGIRSIYPHDKLADRDKKLGYYYHHKKDYKTSIKFLKRAVKVEPWDKHLESALKQLEDAVAAKSSLLVKDLGVSGDLRAKRCMVGFKDVIESIDNVDVSDAGVIRFRPGSNNIMVYGFSGGCAGQTVTIVKSDWPGVVVIKHANDKGVQKIMTKDGKALILGQACYGGATFVYEGNYWYEISR